jgi:hypothetical protein
VFLEHQLEIKLATVKQIELRGMEIRAFLLEDGIIIFGPEYLHPQIFHGLVDLAGDGFVPGSLYEITGDLYAAVIMIIVSAVNCRRKWNGSGHKFFLEYIDWPEDLTEFYNMQVNKVKVNIILKYRQFSY